MNNFDDIILEEYKKIYIILWYKLEYNHIFLVFHVFLPICLEFFSIAISLISDRQRI